MKKNEPIAKVMTSDVVTIQEGELVSKVRQLFQETGVHHLPVLSGQKLVGIMSWNDFLKATIGDLEGHDPDTLDEKLDEAYTLDELMIRNPVTVDFNGTVQDAAVTLGDREFHSLPVVDDGELVGIVTSSDLIRFLADLL